MVAWRAAGAAQSIAQGGLVAEAPGVGCEEIASFAIPGRCQAGVAYPRRVAVVACQTAIAVRNKLRNARPGATP